MALQQTLDRIVFWSGDTLGYLLCELSFRAECRGPFALAYRAGCWCYGKGDDAGIRCGELIENPDYRPDAEQPLYIRRLP
jgi:hypothetical protein